MRLGAIELPLTCAGTLDPTQLGLEYWLAGMPANDPRKDVFDRRVQCYELVLDSLSVFENKAAHSEDQHALEEADAVHSYAYDLAISSSDQLFHATLYDWLIRHQLADDLLEVGYSFLTSFD